MGKLVNRVVVSVHMELYSALLNIEFPSMPCVRISSSGQVQVESQRSDHIDNTG